LVKAQLIVTEEQLNELLKIEPISVHKVVDSKLYVHSFTKENLKLFNGLKKQALFLSTENIGTEEEYEVFKLL